MYTQGRRNERKSGQANAYVSMGGVWGGAPAFFFFGFVLYDLVQNMHDCTIANDENRSDQCVLAGYRICDIYT